MKNPAPDVRVDRTFGKLKLALFSIINENNQGVISVSLLCKKSGISSSTFYDYFHSVQELLDYFTDQCIRDLQGGIKAFLCPENRNYIDYYCWLLNYIENNKNEFKCLYAFEKQTNFISKTDVFFLENSDQVCSRSRFCQYGANAIIKAWLASDCKEPAREVAVFLAETVRCLT